jgi:hypothetical protein
MAHYAFITNEIVTEVITGIDETETIDGLDTETWYGNFRRQTCKRTSYNTIGGVNKLGGTPFRFNYAGIGYIYDEVRDGFIPPKCHDEAVVNDKCLWDCTNADHTLAL